MSFEGSIVFVVDDDDRVRSALCGLLASAGHRVSSFASASAFLSCERPDMPACLLLDLALPGLSGLELQQALATTGGPPIVFVTGQGDVPTSVKAMKAGAVEFLSKPFGDEELLRAIDAALVLDRGAREKTGRAGGLAASSRPAHAA